MKISSVKILGLWEVYSSPIILHKEVFSVLIHMIFSVFNSVLHNDNMILMKSIGSDRLK
jgi:hypothetical protein